MTQDHELIEAWKREAQAPFAGWDFAHLAGRMIEAQPPWLYAARAAELMRQASAVVDLGTGGGERYLALRDAWPPKVAATEDYPPNVKLATERLAPLGVRVVEAPLTDDSPLPFANGEFDLVLNRHSSFNANEVARILAPGGTFLTQQVHGRWAHDLIAAFGATPPWPDSTPDIDGRRLRAAGLTLTAVQDWSGRLSFTDVGAIVYYLKAVPWLVAGFSVDTHLDYLFALQRRLESGQDLSFAAKLYLIEARKETA